VQEGSGVTFDIAYPRHEFAAEEMVLLFCAALAGYGAFRGAGWLLKRYREQLPWRGLRIWWPLLTTGWVSVTWFALHFASPEGMWLILLAGPAWSLTILNLPATMIAVLVMDLLDGLAAVWLCVACSIGAYCAAGYGWVWLLEWYAWRDEEVSLDLRGPERSD
jgi:hypothetical protein